MVNELHSKGNALIRSGTTFSVGLALVLSSIARPTGSKASVRSTV